MPWAIPTKWFTIFLVVSWGRHSCNAINHGSSVTIQLWLQPSQLWNSIPYGWLYIWQPHKKTKKMHSALQQIHLPAIGWQVLGSSPGSIPSGHVQTAAPSWTSQVSSHPASSHGLGAGTGWQVFGSSPGSIPSGHVQTAAPSWTSQVSWHPASSHGPGAGSPKQALTKIAHKLCTQWFNYGNSSEKCNEETN